MGDQVTTIAMSADVHRRLRALAAENGLLLGPLVSAICREWEKGRLLKLPAGLSREATLTTQDGK